MVSLSKVLSLFLSKAFVLLRLGVVFLPLILFMSAGWRLSPPSVLKLIWVWRLFYAELILSGV